MDRISQIFLKELSVELRQKYVLGGIILFSATLVFVVYKVFNQVSGLEWSILLWIITLFAGLNAIVKSFAQEKKETYFYYYSLFDPLELAVAKLIYNTLFLSIIFVLILGWMSLFMGFPVKDMLLFSAGSFLGVAGLSIVMTFVSLLASSEQSGGTLMAILAIPLVLPVLLLLLKITAVSLRLLGDSAVNEDLYLLAGLDALMLGCVVLLFPLVWRS